MYLLQAKMNKKIYQFKKNSLTVSHHYKLLECSDLKISFSKVRKTKVEENLSIYFRHKCYGPGKGSQREQKTTGIV